MQTFLTHCEEHNFTNGQTRSKLINIFYEFIYATNLEIIEYILAQDDKDELIREIEIRWNYRIIFFAVQTFYINGSTAKQEEMLRSLLNLGFLVHAPMCDDLFMP